MKKLLIVIALALSSPAFAGGGGGSASGGATEVTQILNNGELMSQVANSMRQINNEIQMINQLAAGLNPAALAAHALGMQGQAKQMTDLINSSQSLYGSLSSEQSFLNNIYQQYGASNLSPAQWAMRELQLAQQGNQMAQATMTQAQTVFKQVQDDIAKRKALTAQLGGNPTLNQQAATTNQYLDLLAGQNAALMSSIANSAAREAGKIQREAAQQKADVDAYQQWQKQMQAAHDAALQALKGVKPTGF